MLMMKALKTLVLRLWLKLSKIEHDLLRKEHVLAARARVAVEHEAVVVGEAMAAVDHIFERPISPQDMEKIEVL